MRQSDSGFGLVSVLLVVLVLSLMAGSLGMLARGTAKEVSAQEDRVSSLQIADAAIYDSLLHVTDRRESHWTADGSVQNVSVGGGRAQVRITDEDGRIDVNTADPDILARLISALGESQSEAASIADSIRDWTDPDDLRRPNGAEADDYRGAGFAYTPRNQPFETVDELLLVKGVTPDLYEKMLPSITIYSGAMSPNPAKASDFVRSLTNGSLSVQASVIGARSVAQALGGKAFRIHAEVSGKRKIAFVREAIVRITDNPRDPYWILSWR